jgi:hypothetical protein
MLQVQRGGMKYDDVRNLIPEYEDGDGSPLVSEVDDDDFNLKPRTEKDEPFRCATLLYDQRSTEIVIGLVDPDPRYVSFVTLWILIRE